MLVNNVSLSSRMREWWRQAGVSIKDRPWGKLTSCEDDVAHLVCSIYRKFFFWRSSVQIVFLACEDQVLVPSCLKCLRKSSQNKVFAVTYLHCKICLACTLYEENWFRFIVTTKCARNDNCSWFKCPYCNSLCHQRLTTYHRVLIKGNFMSALQDIL